MATGDFSIEQANEQINKYTMDFIKSNSESLVVGNDTIVDVLNREFKNNDIRLTKAIIDLQPNLARVLQHRKNSLIIYMKANNIPNYTTQPTQPQKEIEYINTSKIDWKKDERLIPYLIHLLNTNGYINEKNQFAFIEKHFTANGKPIKRENIKANYNQADYLNKHINKSPKEIKQINDFIEQLNILLNALE